MDRMNAKALSQTTRAFRIHTYGLTQQQADHPLVSRCDRGEVAPMHLLAVAAFRITRCPSHLRIHPCAHRSTPVLRGIRVRSMLASIGKMPVPASYVSTGSHPRKTIFD